MPTSNNCDLNNDLNDLEMTSALQSLMIVEDDSDLQEFYELLFKPTPWRIITQINNCLMAKMRYTEISPKPTIVLIDIELPGCSGFSVARYILKHNPVQKIIFISGKVDIMDDSSIPFDLCCFPRMSKPFRVHDLFDVLNKLASSN